MWEPSCRCSIMDQVRSRNTPGVKMSEPILLEIFSDYV